jgi:hypothetical protein
VLVPNYELTRPKVICVPFTTEFVANRHNRGGSGGHDDDDDDDDAMMMMMMMMGWTSKWRRVKGDA